MIRKRNDVLPLNFLEKYFHDGKPTDEVLDYERESNSITFILKTGIIYQVSEDNVFEITN